MTGMSIAQSQFAGASPHAHAAHPRPKPDARKEVSEITAAMGGALFGVALSEKLPGGIWVGLALLVVFGCVGWYAARQVNKNRR